MYMAAYATNIQPVNGSNMWDHTEGTIPLPPLTRRMPGRPKVNRRKAASEAKEGHKFPTVRVRVKRTVRCSKCQQLGHNVKSCKNEEVSRPPKVPKPPGRPRKDGAIPGSTNMQDGAPSTGTNDGAGLSGTKDVAGTSGTNVGDKVLGKRKKRVVTKRGKKLATKRSEETINVRDEVQESQLQESQEQGSQAKELFQRSQGVDSPIRWTKRDMEERLKDVQTPVRQTQGGDIPIRWTKSMLKERSLSKKSEEVSGHVVKSLNFEEAPPDTELQKGDALNEWDIWCLEQSGYTAEDIAHCVAMQKIEKEQAVQKDIEKAGKEDKGDRADVQTEIEKAGNEDKGDKADVSKDDELDVAMKDIDDAYEAAMLGADGEKAALNEQDEHELYKVQQAEAEAAFEQQAEEYAFLNALHEAALYDTESEHELDLLDDFGDMDYADEMEEVEQIRQEEEDVEEQPEVIDAEPRPKKVKQMARRRKPSQRIMMMKMKKAVIPKDGSGCSSSKPITLE